MFTTFIQNAAHEFKTPLTTIGSSVYLFTPGGTVTVSANQADDEVWIEIADTGIGIELHQGTMTVRAIARRAWARRYASYCRFDRKKRVKGTRQEPVVQLL